jgi:putative endonuclease
LRGEHRDGVVAGFTKQYGLKRLVYAEQHDAIEDAIQRETSIKRWSRAWKINLIIKDNPDWDGLYERIT